MELQRSLANLAEYKSKKGENYEYERTGERHEEINGRKRSESKLTPNKNKIYIGIALAVLVTLILVSSFHIFWL